MFFLVQNVNLCAFRNPAGPMDNIAKATEHIRAKNPG